jgi:tape measure domain-containing protein
MGGFSGSLGTMAIEVVAKVDQYLTDIANVADQTDKAIDAMDKKFQGLQNIGGQLAGLGAGLTAGITLPIVGLAAASINAAGDLDSLMKGLTAVAGSSDKAQEQLGRLKEVAKLPGLGLEEAVQGSIRLQAVGTTALEAERQMKAFGNALATVGKGKADLDGVIAQLVQMSSKTKVVAEDLKPIMERVPQAATIIKQAYGTIDTEVIQKMGVGTQELINTVVAGLEKLPPVAGGIKNAFENLQDSLKNSLAQIGMAFVPILESVTPIIAGVLDGIASLANWFAELPGPIQAAVGGIVAFAAAIGPIIGLIGGVTMAVGAAMPALVGLAGVFGVSVAALLPLTVAIGAAVGIIALMGTQAVEVSSEMGNLYDSLNTGSSVTGETKGVIEQLTDALKGMGSEAASSGATFGGSLATVGTEAKKTGDAANWLAEAIKNMREEMARMSWSDYLTPMGMFKKLIKDTTDVINTFRGVWPEMEKVVVGSLKNITDANTTWSKSQADAAMATVNHGKDLVDYGKTLKDLGITTDKEVNKKIGELRTQLGGLDAALKAGKITAHEYEQATLKLGNEIEKLSTGYDKQSKNAKAAEEQAKKAAKAAGDRAVAERDAWDAMNKRYEDQGKAALKEAKWIEDNYAKYKQVNQQIDQQNAQLANSYGAAYQRIRDEVQKTVKITVPLFERIPQVVLDAIKSTKELADAFQRLGIQSAESLKTQADHAQADYERIANDGRSSARDIEQAWVRTEEIRQAAAKQAGDFISAEEERILKKRKEALETHLTDWQKFVEGVKGLMRNLQHDVAGAFSGALWDFSARGKVNEDLDKQAEDLRGSLAEQGAEWEKYQSDVAGQMAQLTTDHADELSQMESDYRDSLASREADYADYAKEVASNIEEIKTTHAKELEEESGRLRDALDDKENDYANYVDDVNRRMEEIRQNYADKLEQETNDLRDSLRDRLQQYQDFVSDANNKMQRLGEDTQTNIERETKDTASNIADRQRDYDRYAEDTADKISDVRAKNKGVYSQEEADLQRSLRRKKEDLDSYVAEQNRKLQEYIDDQKKRQAREEQDNKDSLDRKARDYDEFVVENKAKQDQAYTDYKTGLDRDIGEQQIALGRRTEDMEQFRIDTAGKLEALTVKHQEEQDKEILAQETALTKKRTALDTYNADALVKYETDRANAEAKYTEQLADLNQSLADKKAAYDQYVIDTNTKLGELATQHRTLWGDIKDNMVGAFTDAGQALTTFVTDFLIGKLFKELGHLIDDLLPSVTKGMKGAFDGGTSSVPGVPSVPSTPSVPSIPGGGGGGGASSGIMGFLSGGLLGNILAVGQLGMSVFQSFQFAAMNKSLDLIEHNTRYSMMFLGERGDGGIIDATLKTSEKLNYVNASLDDIRQKMIDFIEPMKNDVHTIMERFSFAQTRLDEISSNTYWGMHAVQDNQSILLAIRDMLTSQPKATTVTINTYGSDSKVVGETIAGQLRLQGGMA